MCLSAAIGAGALAACAAGTGGEQIELELAFERVVSGDQPPHRFETFSGWTVTLSEARIALGAVYLNENPSLLARIGEGLSEALVPTAHAHPGHGHFAGGEVRGEWLGQIAFDGLSTEPRVITGVPGVAGPVRSFTVLLDPPRADLRQVLEGAHARVVGEARRDGLVVAFEGGLTIADPANQRLDGVALEGDLAQDTRVVISVDLAPWFDEAQFDRLLDEDGQCVKESDEGRCVITEGDQVHTAWLLGARSATSISGAIVSRGGAS